MERVRIGLITLDMRFASRVRRSAEKMNAEIIHVSDIDELPLTVKSIIARREETRMNDPRIIYAEDYQNEDELVERALEIALGLRNYKVAAVAVDPGKNMGAAYMVDGRIIGTKRYGLIEALVNDIVRFLKSHGKASRYVLIGSSRGLDIGGKILDEIKRQFYGEEVKILRVDEFRTSKWVLPRDRGMSRDEYAALILLLKNFFRLG